MIVHKKEEEKKSTPFTIEITVESQKEAQELRAIFNYSAIAEAVSFAISGLANVIPATDNTYDIFREVINKIQDGVSRTNKQKHFSQKGGCDNGNRSGQIGIKPERTTIE